MNTFDCEASLNDYELLEWCRSGYLMLEGVVSDPVNQLVMEHCERHAGKSAEIPISEPWFVEAVVLNPVVTGVVRSLLGREFAYSETAASHRSIGPLLGQRWHRDGGAVHGPKVDCLQVFYLPQDTTVEMGPTELLPGSHHLFHINQYMAHYGRFRGAVMASAPAGSLFVTHYGIWHRRATSTAPRVRNLLKFWYLRTTDPTPDWIHCDDFSLERSFHLPGGSAFGRESHLVRNEATEMMYWLSGQHELFARVVPSSNLPLYYFGNAARPSV